MLDQLFIKINRYDEKLQPLNNFKIILCSNIGTKKELGRSALKYESRIIIENKEEKMNKENQ